jgi:GPH family glycoside/pentoside/hexuronide:cation symporter
MDPSCSNIHHLTAPRDRVSLREKIGLGFGRTVVDGTHGSLYVLANPIYNMTLGVNPALISTCLFIQRFWDAMIDPLIGQMSDNFRSRWGRRIPLLFVAVFPLSLLFAMLWWFPRGASEYALFWHLLLVSLVFYAAHSLFAMPLGGLLLEATDDYHERTRIVGVSLAFGFAVQIASQWIFPLTQLSLFPDTITGLRWVTGGCALFFIAAGLMPVLLCRERLYRGVAARQPHISLISSLRAVRDNRKFLAVLAARFVASFGFNLVGLLGYYMNTYYVFGGDLKGAAFAYGFLGSSYHVAALLASLLAYPWLERRIGKKAALQSAAGLLIFGCCTKLFLYQPGHPWLQLVFLSINGVANAGFTLMTTAMLADIADFDEWQTGLRREAIFSSLLSWFEKAGNSLGALLTGFLLVWIGFNAKLGAQSQSTLVLMKYSYVVAPAAGALLVIWLIRRYDLSEDRAYEIKADLTRRRAASPPPAS